MTRFATLGVVTLAMAMLTADAMAQRRGGGGAVSGGVRGAAIGGMVGGSERKFKRHSFPRFILATHSLRIAGIGQRSILNLGESGTEGARC